MTEYSYESYGERARLIEDPTLASGRLLMRAEAARLIVHDVIHKLDIRPTDELLDVGCGIGQVGIPLSFLVDRYVGIDHPDVVRRFRERLPQEKNVDLISGRFPQVQLDSKFTKILVYDAIHYCGLGELRTVLDALIALLGSGGRMLLGNVPNHHMKARFYSSAIGKKYLDEWEEAFAAHRDPEVEGLLKLDRRAKDPDLTDFGDGVVLEMLRAFREAGYDAWAMPQNWRLPMGVEREDIIVCRH